MVKMKRSNKAKKDIDTRIHRMCMMAGTTECEMEELGSALLEAFHDVCRYNTDAANDIMADLCYQPDMCFEKESEINEMSRAVTRLEIFLSDARKDEYEREIERIQQTAGMLNIMNALTCWVHNFGKYGPEYADILNTRYMNRFDYTNAEASEILNMGESTYYRKKKAAVILFGLAFLEYRANWFGGNMGSDPNGMQMHMAL